MAEEDNRILKALESRMDEVMSAYEKQLADYHLKYQEMVDDANRQMLQLVEKAQTQTKRAPKQKPETVWTAGNDGEPLLIMNKAAADYMATVFDSVGDLVKELDKLIKRGRIK
jgi:hypothetical protein